MMREGRNGGKLKSGNTVNVGRPREIPRLDVLLADFFDDDEKVKEIFTALYEKAKEGDVRAAEALLDRMYGKASQKIESKITTDTPLVITLTNDKPNEETD